LLAACASTSEPEKTLSEQNKKVALRFIQEAVLDGNAAVVDELCAPDIVNHAASGNHRIGVEGVKRVVGFSKTAQPDQRWTWKAVVAEGDLVIVYGVREATWQGEKFRGISTPKGKHIAVELSHMFRLRGGKIVEHWAVRDDLEMMQQLGAIEAAPAAQP
jgi:predicted ester cyclase